MTPSVGQPDNLYKEFPPRWRNQLIPTSSRAAALAGLSTYTAIRPLGLLVRNLSWLAVSLFGPAILPTRSRPLDVPMGSAVLGDLVATLGQEVGSFDEVSVHRQRGDGRTGFALLLLKAGDPRAFVKLRRTDQDDALQRERDAIRTVTAFGPRQFKVPGVIGFGELQDWSFLALEPFAPAIHRTPSNPPIEMICVEIASALSRMPRPVSTPLHWLPMHGDFTPWNLRQLRQQLTLFDWEHVGWGPPGSDAALYQLTSHQLHLKTSHAMAIDDDARRYWLDQGRIRNKDYSE